MLDLQNHSAPSGWLVAGAFGLLYIIWGAVFLVIAYAIETLPPLLMMGVRLIIAGPILYGWTLLRGVSGPTIRQWRDAAIIGGLVMSAGVGVAAWAQLFVPSSMAGVLTGTVSIWMVLMDWPLGGPRPTGRVAIGLVVGILGIALIAGPDALNGTGDPQNLIAIGVMLVTVFCWAAGSIYARRADLPANLLQETGMQMIVGGGILVVLGSVVGEWSGFNPNTISLQSALAWVYLILLAGVVAFSVYFWLLRVSTTARVSTFGYVIPLVALFLGWALRDEVVTLRTLVASAIIIGGVALIATQSARAEPAIPDATMESSTR